MTTDEPLRTRTGRLAPDTELLGLVRVGALLRATDRVECYEAEHLVLGRAVRVWLRVDLDDAPEPRRRRFFDAMAALARGRRRELLDVYQPFEHDGLVGAVTEALARPTLADELAARPGVAWSAAATRAWIAPMLRALHALHTLGLVHGRLSPASVVRPRTDARLVDLVELRLDPPSLDDLEHLDPDDLRTLAPEWLAAPGDVGPSADLYAAGCILFRLLTGTEVTDDSSSSSGSASTTDPRTVLAAHLSERPPDPAARLPGLDEGMGCIVMRALTRHPGLRFESAAEMADAVEQHATYLRPVAVASPPWAAQLDALLARLAPPPAPADIPVVEEAGEWPGPPADDPLATMPGRFLRLPGEAAADPRPSAPTQPPEPPRAPLASPALGGAAFESSAAARRRPRSLFWLALGLALACAAGLLAWWLLALKGAGGEARVEPQPGQVRALLGGEVAAGDDMAVVPGGAVLVGGGAASGFAPDDALDARAVWVSPFAIDRREVTVEAYQACVAAGLCEARQGSATQPGESEQHPVTRVTWRGADAFCRAQGKRLPTEAEWEKAARGTDGRDWPWGERFACARANVGGEACAVAGGGAALPEAVGARASGASPYGVENLADNVWEWTADWYASADWHLERGAQRDPGGPLEGPGRVIKGGDYAAAPRPAAARAWNPPEAWSERGGFRCALSLPGDPRSGIDELYGQPPRARDDRLARWLLGGSTSGPVLERPRRPR